MNDVVTTWHNFETLLEGKSTFNEFVGDECKMIETDIGKMSAPFQPAVTLMFTSFKAGVSALVGVGLSVAGPFLSEATSTQATQVLNLMSALGIPTEGPLSVAELAMLQAAINGLKAGLDKIGLNIATSGTATKAGSAVVQPAA